MENPLICIAQWVVLLPLIGAIFAGLIGKKIGPKVTSYLTIGLVFIAFVLASYLFYKIVGQHHVPVEGVWYQWMQTGVFTFNIAILLDPLSVTMITVVTFVALTVHIYSIGYMRKDPGFERFFCYVSLFTFAMLILVLANNFLLLFFGWEGVGLVSYLLIGFWFTKESAAAGGLKAFLVNRISDIGFILALAAVLLYFNTFNYSEVFNQLTSVIPLQMHFLPGVSVSVITLICVLLFIGAMGKSAQVPFHVWLPESMEGPTPISALIHAATMVTAGIYMVARMSPLFEYSEVALSLVTIVGAITCLFMGILALTQFDIKRVIAYSTLSQLGYMTVALGVSAFNAAIFHLITHAFFKALLFLAAGSVIVALHHEQDMRKMGGLASIMPITYLTFCIGALALAAAPPFSGFYSKDIIIEAVRLSTIPGAGFAGFCILAGAFITPWYIFRAIFMTFHGAPQFKNSQPNVKESPWVILLPLIALAIPSLMIGGILIKPMLFAAPNLLQPSIFVLPSLDALHKLSAEFKGAMLMAITAPHTLTFWLMLAGIFTAWFFTCAYPKYTESLKRRFSLLYWILIQKYGFDSFNDWFFVRGTRKLGNFLYRYIDLRIIDGFFVNGAGKGIRQIATFTRKMQTGYLYHYAGVMILGLALFLAWFIFGF